MQGKDRKADTAPQVQSIKLPLIGSTSMETSTQILRISMSWKQNRRIPQHIWNVFVDLDKRIVTGISEEPERIMKETLQPNLIYTGMNMFMPDTVKVNLAQGYMGQ